MMVLSVSQDGEVHAAAAKKQCGGGGGRKSKAKAAPAPTKDPQSVAAKVKHHFLCPFLLENLHYSWETTHNCRLVSIAIESD
jgi:hypothetical protein